MNVQCFPQYSIMLAIGTTEIDYFSVDVEGSESQVLMNIPWHRINIKVYVQLLLARQRLDYFVLLSSHIRKRKTYFS